MPIPLELFRVGGIKRCNALNYFWLIAAINISNAALFFPHNSKFQSYDSGLRTSSFHRQPYWMHRQQWLLHVCMSVSWCSCRQTLWSLKQPFHLLRNRLWGLVAASELPLPPPCFKSTGARVRGQGGDPNCWWSFSARRRGKDREGRRTMGLYCFSQTRGMHRLRKDRPVRADIDLQPSPLTTPGWGNEAINHGVQGSL